MSVSIKHSARKRISNLAAAVGVALVIEGITGTGHIKLRLPTGKLFIIANSPSDYRSDRNALSDLRKALAS